MADDAATNGRKESVDDSSNNVHIDIADDEVEMTKFPISTRKRSMTFSPWKPDTISTVLSWKDVTVSTKTTPTKILLNNVSGEILGGFYAIMGSSGTHLLIYSLLHSLITFIRWWKDYFTFDSFSANGRQ